jgi:hypothetical protein
VRKILDDLFAKDILKGADGDWARRAMAHMAELEQK